MSIAILLVEDHESLRGVLRRFLEMEPDIRVVGEAGTGSEVVELVRHHSPDIVLVDFGLPDVTGLEVTRRIKAARLDTRVIVMSMHSEEPYRRTSLDNGADAFCPKDDLAAKLFSTIRQIMASDRRGEMT